MNEFLLISIVGVITSLIIEGINKFLGADSFGAKLITIATAIVIGTFYVLFNSTDWFPTVLGILAASSTVYAFFLKRNK